ncbi:MAG: hypothetical protein KDA97_09735 [Acidimicrobiales bacterium]|nr:hypothetical protein [Acidimicrobiales bacterium]
MSTPTMPSAPVAGEQVPWPTPPREPGPWDGGPPIAPPGNTPLPPLPGAGGVVHGGGGAANPWTAAPPTPVGPPGVAQPPPGAPGPGQLVDRAPLPLLIVAGLILVAGIAGLAYVVAKGGRTYPSAWDDRVAPIAEDVAELRELEFEHPVEVNFLDAEAYSARATEGSDDSVEATAAYEDFAAQLRALGLLEGDVDLGEATETLGDAGTLAFYDPSVEQVYVRGTELTPALRVTLAHELVHVLQDQHFDLERVEGDGDDDGRSASLRALAEGDAEAIEDAYVAEVLTDDERTLYEEETRASGEGADDELADVPPVLTTFFASPYILGPRTIAYLEEEGGHAAIDDALADPPTEEELFNPLIAGTEAAEIRGDLSAQVPEGATELERGDFGPTAWYLVLDSRLDSTQAMAAVDGWGGDEYAVYRDDDRVCVAATVIGDDEEATARLGDALTAWVDGSPADTAEISVDAGVIRFRSCDPGAEAEATGDAVTPDVLVVPTARVDLYLELVGLGVDGDDAECMADGVVHTVPAEKMLDGYLQTEASADDFQALRAECGF